MIFDDVYRMSLWSKVKYTIRVIEKKPSAGGNHEWPETHRVRGRRLVASPRRIVACWWPESHRVRGRKSIASPRRIAIIVMGALGLGGAWEVPGRCLGGAWEALVRLKHEKHE